MKYLNESETNQADVGGKQGNTNQHQDLFVEIPCHLKNLAVKNTNKDGRQFEEKGEFLKIDLPALERRKLRKSSIFEERGLNIVQNHPFAGQKTPQAKKRPPKFSGLKKFGGTPAKIGHVTRFDMRAWALKVSGESMKNGEKEENVGVGKERERGRKRSRREDDKEEEMEERSKKRKEEESAEKSSCRMESVEPDENPKSLQSNCKRKPGEH